ncbi:MAG: LCP family protein [Clostridia bacterium]|nr:LCP family protein [Clostridia bacterium]
MAKDRRSKQTKTVDLETDVVREQPKKEKTRSSAPAKKRKKKKRSRAATILRAVFAVLVVTVLIFLLVLGNYIYKTMFYDDREKVDPIPSTYYDVTPQKNRDKVSYYMVGVLGNGENDDLQMLSVVCHDKKAGTVNVMEIPPSTYLEMGDTWIVDTVGSVFADPKPLDWCETCRKHVFAPEIEEGEKKATHTPCGTEVTLKKGSAVSSVVDFVNDQLGLPVDEYFLIPAKGLGRLVDAVGGVDVELASSYTLGETTYDSGVQTLDGAAVIDYACPKYSDAEESTCMIRMREVFGALLTRIFRMEKEAIELDVVEEVMDSSYPIRTACTQSEIVTILEEIKPVGAANIMTQFLPGEDTYDSDGDYVYTAHTDELLALIQSSFNPIGDPVTEADIGIPELANSGAADTRRSTLKKYIPEQTGMLLDTEE